MKKKLLANQNCRVKQNNFVQKLKLCLLSVLISVNVLYATESMQEPKVTINVSSISVMDFFSEIQRQTGYSFIFDSNEIRTLKALTIHATNKSLKDLLNEVLTPHKFKWHIDDGFIIVAKENKTAKLPETSKKLMLKGVVTDVADKPIPGVTIMVKGTQKGTTSNNKGEFAIDAKQGDVLVFSFVGMKTQEIKVGQQNELRVALDEIAVKVDDVVITGYFNRASDSFTGSAKTISKDELLQANPTNVLSALAIVDPSFKMIENNNQGSNPNLIPQFEIRGSSSFPDFTDVTGQYQGQAATNMPTFIMDGFEVSAEKVFDLDPLRIESITLLKDAAATAIYGSRAANGVVVITTVVPKSGTIDINYNLNLVGGFPDLRDYDILNAVEKLELERRAGYYDTPQGYVSNYSREGLLKMYNELRKNVEKGFDTYWLNKPLQNTVSQTHTLSVDGGTQNLRFSINGYLSQQPGIMKKSGRDKKGLSMMLQYTVHDKLILRNTISYDDVRADNSPYGDYSLYVKQNPYMAAYDEYGNVARFPTTLTGSSRNPLLNSDMNTKDFTKYNEWRNNFSLDWYIMPELRFKLSLSISQRDNQGVKYTPAGNGDAVSTNWYLNRELMYGTYNATDGRASLTDGNISLSYNKKIKGHYISANAVVNAQDSKGDNYTVYMEGYPVDQLDYISFGLRYSETRKLTGSDSRARLIGFLGSVNYSWENRFLADFSFRADGSSRFGSEKRWAPFWSVGAGWNIHNEKFMSSLTFINQLKIRGSYGYTGSQNYSPYQAMVFYNYDLANTYKNLYGATMKGLGNKDLKWQQNLKANVGLNLALLDNTVALTFDYYREKSSGLLTDVMLPASLGFASYRDNVGEVLNSGWETSLRVAAFKNKDAHLYVTLAATRNKNTLKKISSSLMAWNSNVDGQSTTKPKVRYIEGESMNTIWGVRSLGINPTSGKEIFVKPDGTYTDLWMAEDQVPIGVDEPKLRGTINLNGRWKNFQLSMSFQYRLGGEYYNQTLVDRVENADKRWNCDRRVLDQRWQKEGDITFYKDIRSSEITLPTSRFVNKYSYLQLAATTLTYDFNKELIAHIGMKSLRLGCTVNDLLRFSTVKMERGINYPFAQYIQFSLQTSF